MLRMRWLVAMIGVAAVAAMSTAGAQAPGDDSAPPASNALVARLSAISGTVSTSRGDTGEWDTGALNTPLVSGDKVAAGEGARAEVQIDYADLLRLGSNSQANLTELNNDQIQVQVAAGLADYVVLRDARASAEIDTPNVAVRPSKEGVYRINVISDDETDVIVRQGEAEVSTPQGSTLLKKGQLMTIQGTDNPEYQIAEAPAQDAWDRWNKDRDHSIETAVSFQHTNPYYTGVQSLDGYGNWTVVPGYGNVWMPEEGAGWTPYSDGRWVYEPGWGWTWVGYEPWGWAPYHYGRWMMYDAQWAWWPGPVTPFYRPLWAPAYVSFFGFGGGGFGGGFGVGVGFGSIGWLPIGPCDPFRPWWGGRGRTSINITNVTVINNYRNGAVIAPLAIAGRGRTRYSNLDAVMTNARVRAAVNRVPAADFGRGAVGARQHVSVTELRGGRVLGGSLPVRPGQESLHVGRPIERSVVSRPVANSFYAVHRAPEVRGGVNAGPARFGSRGTGQSAVHEAAPAQSGRPADNGFRRFGAAGAPGPRQAAPEARPQPQAGAPDRGFQRFGAGGAPGPRQAAPEARPQPQAGAPDRGFQRFGAGGDPGPRQVAPEARPQPQAAAPDRGFQRFGAGGDPGPRQVAPEARPQPQAAAPDRGFQRFGGARQQGPPEAQPQARPESAPRAYSRPPLPVGHSIVEAPRPMPQPRPQMSNPGRVSSQERAPQARGQSRDAHGR